MGLFIITERYEKVNVDVDTNNQIYVYNDNGEILVRGTKNPELKGNV